MAAAHMLSQDKQSHLGFTAQLVLVGITGEAPGGFARNTWELRVLQLKAAVSVIGDH